MSPAVMLVRRGDWRRVFARIPDAQIDYIAHHPWLWLNGGQQVPPGDWRTWLMLAGRGFGKTFAGAHWVHGHAMAGGRDTRIALVAATLAEGRNVMVEGDSGLLAIAPKADRPVWLPARGVLCWRNGATAHVYSGENPEGLRGPQHDFAWCDELGKWAYPQATWDNLQLGLRLGDRPRALVTTTPRPVPLLRALIADPSTAVTRGGTAENLALPSAFVAAVTEMYGGTRYGRQELGGELIEDVAGALWTRAMLELCRARALPEVTRVVVGVDPPAGQRQGPDNDEAATRAASSSPHSAATGTVTSSRTQACRRRTPQSGRAP